MKLKSLGSLLLAAWVASSCGEEPRAPGAGGAPAAVRATRQEVNSSEKVLILGSSVNGGLNSVEAQAVATFKPGWPIDVVTPAQWSAMTTAQFMSYQAIIIGDAACTSGTAALQAAIDTRDLWAPAIDSNIVIVATNSSSGSKPQITRNGIEQVLMAGELYRTSLYISLGCAYQNAPAGTLVTLLDHFGEFRVQGNAAGCAATQGHIFEMFPDLLSHFLDDSYLGLGGCAARSVFTTYPVKNFAVAAIGLNAPGNQEYIDYVIEPTPVSFFGTPYILVRGAMSVGSGCGGNADNVPPGEECDFGDMGNGQPAPEGWPASETCSFSCHQGWCGDGAVDPGEECDNGIENGRDRGTGDLASGMCSAACKIVNFPPTGQPPTALCRNVTVSAPSNACGAPADINNGSTDQDGDLVGCTQSPVGPYNIGTTTVALTCTDSQNNTAQCQATVTVKDVTAPVVTIGTPNRTVECKAGGSYTDLSDVSASDLCSNPVTALTRTGSVTMGTPGTYTLTYPYKDSAIPANTGSATRTVVVADTLVPILTLNGQTVPVVECGTPYLDPGASATDQCDGNLDSRVVVTGTYNTGVVGVYPVRYNVRDRTGNAATEKVRSINVRDTTRPTVTINPPTSMTVECNDPAYQDPGATATDTCVGTLPATPVIPPNTGSPGTYTVNYKATDPSGNVGTTTTSRTVTVQDTLPPTVTLNGSVTMGLECADPWSDPGATARDQCAGNLPVTTTGSVNNRQLGAQTLTYSASDGFRSDSKVRTVTVSDTRAPAVTPNGPLSVTVECNDPAYADQGATVTEACDPTPPPYVIVNPPPVGTPGSYTVNYRATDRAGNVGTSATGRSVTVRDTLNPTVALNGSAAMNLECGNAWNDPGATASDQCSGSLPVNTTGTVDNRQLSTQTLTYTATDGSGHSDSKTRAVTVRDTQAPTVTLNGPLSQRVECGDGRYQDPGATATDSCAGTLPAVPSTVADPNAPGTYIIGYSATDPSGNVGTSSTSRTVTVQDTLAPVLTLNPAPSTLECATPWNDPGATANDQCAGDLTGLIVRTGTVNNMQPGPYILHYSVTDPSGRSDSEDRAVTVSDTLVPNITVNGPLDDTFECGSTYVDPGATANDACAGTVAVTATRNGSSTTPGQFTITYSATDPSGNRVVSPVVRTVHVNDNAPPTLALVGDASPVVECATSWTDPGATANDACFGDLTASIVRSGNVNVGAVGSYPLIYNVTDAAGNSAPSVNRTVQVRDTTLPVITVMGPASDTYECGTTYNDPGATATDSCWGSLTVTSTRTSDPNAPANFTITYTATDPSGNTAVASAGRTVTVNDDAPPTITLNGPSSQVLECSRDPYNDPGATASDACEGPVPVTASGSVNTGQAGSYMLHYSAQDTAGNTSPTVTRDVTITDTTGPAITLIGPDGVRLECHVDTYTDPGATAEDLCSGPANVTVDASAVNSDVTGVYQVHYTASDASGNPSSTVRNVLVEDGLPPTITLNASNPMVVECATPFVDPGATASDICQGDVSNSVSIEFNGVNTLAEGTYFVRYQAQDTFGHVALATRDVEVNDTTGPMLTVTGAPSAEIECGSQPDLGVQATDACYGILPALAITATPATLPNVPGEYEVTYSATDPAGNATVNGATRRFRVVDTTAPVISVLGPLEQQIECGSSYVDPGATAEDRCAGDLSGSVQTSGSVNTGVVGTYLLTYSVRDLSDNQTTSAESRTVAVVDTQPPSIVCPKDITVEAQSLDATSAMVTLGTATATDACSEPRVSSPSQTEFPMGTTTVTYTAADAAGNTATCTSTVTVTPPDRALLGSGNGCASTGSGPSSLAMMGLGALAALLARKGTRPGLLALGVFLLGAKASAQHNGVPTFELELLKLNPSGTGSLVLGTGELLTDGEYRLSLTAHYENDPLVLFQNGERLGVMVRHRATAHLAAAYGLWGWVELGAQIPMLLLQRGDDLTAYGVGRPEGGLAPGTPLLTFRVKLLAQGDEDPVDLSVGVHAGPSVGSGAALARELRATPSLMAGRRFSLMRAAVDAGMLLRPRKILSPDSNIQDELGHALRLGGTLATLGEGLRGELVLTTLVPLKREGFSIETLAGARWPMSDSFEAYGLAGLAFGNAPGTPDFRVLLGVAYGRARPADGKSVEPEPAPNPPVLPDSPEQDGEAVPEKDSDGDDILDEKDSCPLEAGIPEMHGCPPQDTDQDTVQDHVDNCPEVAGPVENQGCPTEEKQWVAIQKDRIEIKDKVHFDFDKATIQSRSFPLLDQVARILVEHPEILLVTIEGHTDERGSAEYNRDLSQRRAESVREYLAQRGVARERMKARGYGEDRPVQSNATDEGRAANRRVEFITSYTQEGP